MTARLLVFWLAAMGSVQLLAGPPDWTVEDAWYSCSSCHGEDGLGSEPRHAPAIAAQSEQYIRRQLENFRDGVRGAQAGDTYGQQMALMAANLDNSEIAMLAVYIAGLPPRANAARQVVEGKDLYTPCAACHGDQAQGNASLSAPRLRGLTVEYLLRQHGNFLMGLRGAGVGDNPGQQMAAAARLVSDEKDMRLLAAYIHGLGQPGGATLDE